MLDSASFVSLTHEGVLAVQGADSAKFLQGQLTCNLNYLSAQRSSLGARCTPKGRMLASFHILPQGDGYLLALDKPLVEPLLADLKKYAVFFRGTRLEDQSGQWRRFGLLNPGQLPADAGLVIPEQPHEVLMQGSLVAVRLDAGRAELWVPAEQAEAVQEKLAGLLVQAPLQDWLLAQIRAGIGQVFERTRESFVPQMINLQAVGGVSFKKGCYTGQEIVARMQYLGRLKRHLYRLSGPQQALPQPGDPLYLPGQASAVGEVVLAAASEQGLELLAVVQDDALEGNQLQLSEAAGQPLSQQPLPYTLDKDREIQR